MKRTITITAYDKVDICYTVYATFDVEKNKDAYITSWDEFIPFVHYDLIGDDIEYEIKVDEPNTKATRESIGELELMRKFGENIIKRIKKEILLTVY